MSTNINKFIIHLTSISSRFFELEDTLQSLVKQTIKAQMIIISIFIDTKVDNTMKNMIQNKYPSIHIQFLDKDMGPSSKVYAQ